MYLAAILRIARHILVHSYFLVSGGMELLFLFFSLFELIVVIIKNDRADGY